MRRWGEIYTSFVRLTLIMAPNLPSKSSQNWYHGKDHGQVRYLWSFLAYKPCLMLLRRYHRAPSMALLPAVLIQVHYLDLTENTLTIARWKSGLLPLEVLANSVNWDTHRMSPSMSFTLDFHICASLDGSEKTRRVSLQNVYHQRMCILVRETFHESKDKSVYPLGTWLISNRNHGRKSQR